MNQTDVNTKAEVTIEPRAPVEIDLVDPDEVRASAPDGRVLREIGRGRSAVVYLVRDSSRADLARKIFTGDPLAKLVHVVFIGAPNPYTWNDDAIAAAVCRRRILAALVRHWFGDRLRLPGLDGASFNEEVRAHQIDMEFVTGRAAALHHHVLTGREGELRELVGDIMRPLQRHLRESGFDGLVWQAGLGNPVAASNFLLDGTPPGAPTPPGAESRAWVWIDLESGVPALIPLNPLTLLSFYLPKSIRHRGPLFDDVDVEKLDAYLEANRADLEASLGSDAVAGLIEESTRLAAHQQRWKTLGRFASSLAYARRRAHITDEEAAFYRTRPIRWYARLAWRAARRAPEAALHLARKVWRKIVPHSLTTVARMVWRFLFSQRWRARWASHVIRNRVRSWERRRQLSPEESHHLVTHVRSDEATAYLTDFGIHIAIKVPVKMIEWLVFPAMFAAGMIGEQTLLIALASGGAIGRTSYTLGRLIQASLRGRERPWVALATGLLPVVGNAAYPLQILYTSTERDHDVAKFILIDLFTTVGRKLPIWGGPDTQTEHFFNRLPVWFLKRLGWGRARSG